MGEDAQFENQEIDEDDDDDEEEEDDSIEEEENENEVDDMKLIENSKLNPSAQTFSKQNDIENNDEIVNDTNQFNGNQHQYNNNDNKQYYNNNGNRWQPKKQSNQTNGYRSNENKNDYFQRKQQQYHPKK